MLSVVLLWILFVQFASVNRGWYARETHVMCQAVFPKGGSPQCHQQQSGCKHGLIA